MEGGTQIAYGGGDQPELPVPEGGSSAGGSGDELAIL